MKVLILGLATIGIALGTQTALGADAPSHAEMMKACMNKQKSENSQMPNADVKKFCMATLKKQMVSSGPEAGTLDKPHQ